MSTTPKIPTILAIFLLVALIGITIYMVETYSGGQTVANNTIVPGNVEITNITDASLTVSWTTSAQTSGLVTIKPSSGGKQISAFDDRDTDDKVGKYATHYVTVRNLTPGSQYDVTILSNGMTFKTNGKPWQGETFQTLASHASKLEPAYGSVITPDGYKAKGAIVYLSLEGGQKLSALANPSGSWLIPLNVSRTADGISYLAAGDRMTEQIIVRMETGVASALCDTLNDSPVPEITIGKSYDFRKQQATNQETTSLADLSTQTPPVLGAQTSAQKDIGITAPSEGSALSTFLPLIQGTGVPGKTVTVAISIPPQTGTTTIENDGIWRFTPAQNVAPGKQLLIVTTQKVTGDVVTLTRNFEIFKSGTQVLGDATPSGTLSPTPTIKTTITPTPSGKISPTPTPKTTPTPTPLLTGPTPTTSAQTPLGPPGTYTPTLLFLSFGVLLFTFGAGLFLRNETIHQ